MVNWTWTDEKDRANRRKHGLGFELASLIFDDSLALSHPDPHPDGDRWRTVGQVGPLVLFVVHTGPEADPRTGEEWGRIISARRTTAHERKAYEKGNF